MAAACSIGALYALNQLNLQYKPYVVCYLSLLLLGFGFKAVWGRGLQEFCLSLEATVLYEIELQECVSFN